jgi:hypothetical protein
VQLLTGIRNDLPMGAPCAFLMIRALLRLLSLDPKSDDKQRSMNPSRGVRTTLLSPRLRTTFTPREHDGS